MTFSFYREGGRHALLLNVEFGLFGETLKSKTKSLKFTGNQKDILEAVVSITATAGQKKFTYRFQIVR